MKTALQYVVEGLGILDAAILQAEQELTGIHRRIERYRRATSTLLMAASGECSPAEASIALIEARAILERGGVRGPLSDLVEDALYKIGDALADERGAA